MNSHRIKYIIWWLVIVYFVYDIIIETNNLLDFINIVKISINEAINLWSNSIFNSHTYGVEKELIITQINRVLFSFIPLILFVALSFFIKNESKT